MEPALPRPSWALSISSVAVVVEGLTCQQAEVVAAMAALEVAAPVELWVSTQL